MNYTVGIDLGSTTTKAVVLSEEGAVLGRGITNSRSNYKVACDVALSEALIDARFGRSVVVNTRISTVAVRAGLPCDRGTVSVTRPSTGWARTAAWASRNGSSTRRFCTHRMIALSPTSSTHCRTS